MQGSASPDGYKALVAGDAASALLFAGGLVRRIDAGDPLVLLGGIHVGCFELFGSARVRSVRDLKGKTVAVPRVGQQPAHLCGEHGDIRGPGSTDRYSLGDPSRAGAMQLLAEGKIDGFMGFPPEPQELRARADRPCRGQHHDGPPVVPVLLLHGRREPGLRPHAPGRQQARGAGDAEGDRRLRAGAGARAARLVVDKGLRAALRLRGADAAGDSPTTGGASTTPRTRCASTPCACMRPA